MKKIVYICIILINCANQVFCQSYKLDSIEIYLKKTKDFEIRETIINKLFYADSVTKINKLINYASIGLTISRNLNRPKDQIEFLKLLGSLYFASGEKNYPKELEYAFEGLKISKDINDESNTIALLNNIALAYNEAKEPRKAIDYELLLINKNSKSRKGNFVGAILANLGNFYIQLKLLDSAKYYYSKACQAESKNQGTHFGRGLMGLGSVELELKHYKSAIYFFSKARSYFKQGHLYVKNICELLYKTGYTYYKIGNQDSAYYFTYKSYKIADSAFEMRAISPAAMLLSKLFENKNDKESFKYFKIAVSADERMYNTDKEKQFQYYNYNQKQREIEIKNAAREYQNRLKLYIALLFLLLVLFILWITLKINKKQKEANKLLATQKEEIQNTLIKLKSTQTQLIQSEKMASLGELTAGIAHEIQNPLNFVNNFSEVNMEMIDELEDELKTGNIEDALSIAADIKQNEEKINHHGKRADAIVKGMLEHSRAGSGTKEPTDINKLADEYLRLSYHGLRAKDKTFNAEMVTNFDENLPLINVIPQDIGRVLLNLFNNAFYAVNQKQKTASSDFKPEVDISTYLENNQVIIKVKDNGIGIPNAIKDKIMQPFFTTKPTGEGTGLGLSLTYDMVVKGHGGKIEVNSKDGEGTEFVITLMI